MVDMADAPFYIDDDGNDDWIKVLSWDLPVEVGEFLASIGGVGALPAFLQRPAARAMPESLREALVEGGLCDDADLPEPFVRTEAEVAEAVLEEHPGHGSEKVHGRRGGAHPFGTEVANWKGAMARGSTVQVFKTKVERRLAEGAISNFDENSMGGSTYSGVATIDGKDAFAKPENGYYESSITDKDGNIAPRVSEGGEVMIPAGTEPLRELAAYYVDHAMGGLANVPAVVVRTGVHQGEGFRQPLGTPFQMDAKTRWSVAQHAAERMGPGAVTNPYMTLHDLQPRDGRRLALFDSLIGNTDRHGNNFVGYTDAHGVDRVVPIDHGLSFPRMSGWSHTAAQYQAFRLGATEKAALDTLNKNRTKVARDLNAILNDPPAVEGFFQRLDFMRRTGRTITTYDINNIEHKTDATGTMGSWTLLSNIAA